MTSDRRPRRIAMLAVHTSPLAQPGTGDAGGLNVYVVETARRLAARGVEVEVLTRSTSSALPPVAEVAPGVLVRHIPAGPFEGLSKDDLPGQLCAFASGVLRTEATRPPGYYDLIHSHYWLSGQVGWLAAERWQVPLVHTMHTMARVKNLALAAGDTPEPAGREIGERQVVEAADRLVANTRDEVEQLVALYGADPARIAVVAPGVDLDRFTPADGVEDAASATAAARASLGVPAEARLLLFVGRIQPLKAPDVLLRAVAGLLDAAPALRSRLIVAVVGGPSGSGLRRPESLVQLARELGIEDVVRFEPPAAGPRLTQWYRAADVVAVPSYSESFGLVALEAQACGTPVAAADVTGLRDAVQDGASGVLVPGHTPSVWAEHLAALLVDDGRRAELARGALRHARRYSWHRTVDGLLDVYGAALADADRRVLDLDAVLAR